MRADGVDRGVEQLDPPARPDGRRAPSRAVVRRRSMAIDRRYPLQAKRADVFGRTEELGHKGAQVACRPAAGSTRVVHIAAARARARGARRRGTPAGTSNRNFVDRGRLHQEVGEQAAAGVLAGGELALPVRDAALDGRGAEGGAVHPADVGGVVHRPVLRPELGGGDERLAHLAQPGRAAAGRPAGSARRGSAPGGSRRGRPAARGGSRLTGVGRGHEGGDEVDGRGGAGLELADPRRHPVGGRGEEQQVEVLLAHERGPVGERLGRVRAAVGEGAACAARPARW